MRVRLKKIIATLMIIIGIILIIYPFIVKKVTSTQIDSSIKNFIGIVNELENLESKEKIEEVNTPINIEIYSDSRDDVYEENAVKKNRISNNIEDYGVDTKVYSINENKKNNLLDDLYYEMKKYNEDLNKKGQNIVDAFSYETPSFDLMKYGLSENIIGIIKIPKINLELPIYLGATAENLNKGATHLSQTSIPLGEKNSNVVIAAHRSLFRNQFFKNIDKLSAGDEVIIQTLWNELIYKVTIKNVISPSDSSKILIQKDKDLVTLVTCHPYGKTSERYIVYCERK